MSLILRPHRLFDLEKIFDEFFMEPFAFDRETFTLPRMDIKELDDHYEITLEVPGFDKEDINIEIKNDTLTIKSEKEMKKEEKDEKGKYIYKERSYHNFSRCLKIPENVNTEDVKASMDKGVLRIELTKIEPEPPKKIEIQGEETPKE
ncbi:MAG: Hsp20/alpha crystallin family protein [Candidatus Helarchaeota archaeon]